MLLKVEAMRFTVLIVAKYRNATKNGSNAVTVLNIEMLLKVEAMGYCAKYRNATKSGSNAFTVLIVAKYRNATKNGSNAVTVLNLETLLKVETIIVVATVPKSKFNSRLYRKIPSNLLPVFHEPVWLLREKGFLCSITNQKNSCRNGRKQEKKLLEIMI